MEGHRGRWNIALTATVLLLMCIFTLTLSSLSCPYGDYPSKSEICCNKCSPGFKLVEECNAPGHRSNCTPCPVRQYTDQMNYAENCKSCTRCKSSKNEIEVLPCQKHSNTVCQCKPGYYKSVINSDTYDCVKCKRCGENEMEIKECTPTNNTQCECKNNYYRIKSKCEQCKNCTPQCSHHCSTPATTVSVKASTTTSPTFFINTIAAVIVSAIVLLFLVFFITYLITKQSTKKKLRARSSKQPTVFQDSCKVLIGNEESWSENCVKAVPQSPLSEQEPSNLPDCVPPEINIPDLIYTVLDLVPVQQVKQLVRTLGVKDTEIEQAEMDHRSCREAHYQMLRAWAERGSRAGRGGRGRMLHSPLLNELLDQLRKIHLGRAAEELETKYGIQ